MRTRTWCNLTLVVFTSLVLVACGASAAATPTSTLNVATTQTSSQGLYRVSYTPATTIQTNTTHSWTLHVETSAGKPVDNATITVDGGMPAHGHGLPTQPKVTQNLGKGDYLVEGMRFNMPGAWVVTFQITSDGKSDKVTFNLKL